MNKNLAPHEEVLNMSRWYVVSRALQTVAKLGLANHMSKTPIGVESLAKKTETKPELLARLLNFLTNYGLFFHENGAYGLTDLSEVLRDEDPHSIRAVLCMVDEAWWQAFSQMETCLKTGEAGFFHQHGEDFFQALAKKRDDQENFDSGMAKLSSYDDESIASAFDFSLFSSLVELGAGRGGLIQALSRSYPEVRLTLFDSPAVVQSLQQSDFSNKVRFYAGDFFAEIPQAQAYLFKGVLHDFNDRAMERILNNCRSQIPKEARIFIAEQVLPETPFPHPNKTMDIVMMVLLAGRQRTLSEWQKALGNSGFKFKTLYPTKSHFSLMEFDF